LQTPAAGCSIFIVIAYKRQLKTELFARSFAGI